MQDSPSILEYASGAVGVDRLDIRREGDSLVMRIPPPAPWRQIVYQVLQSLGQLAICAIVAGLTLLVATGDRSSLGVLFMGVALGIALYVLIVLVARLFRLGRSARMPSVLI